MESSLNLNHLKDGESAVIRSISADGALYHRLTGLGFRVGKAIAVVRHGRFKGPVQVRIGTTDIIMRRSDAEKIRIIATAAP
ncbi:MAG: FeoA family protein [Methylococcus sp.]|nr:FeoA family protein [Methylococcus sp.]